jgi:hypothetical protein
VADFAKGVIPGDEEEDAEEGEGAGDGVLGEPGGSEAADEVEGEDGEDKGLGGEGVSPLEWPEVIGVAALDERGPLREDREGLS